MLKEVSQFILSCSGLPWTLGINFFAGHLPMRNALGAEVSARVCVILERTPAVVDGQLPDYLEKPFQVWNRNKTYFSAREDAQQIYECLHGFTGWDLPVIVSGYAYHAWIIDAIADPAPLMNPNEQKLFEFSTNYVFKASIPSLP